MLVRLPHDRSNVYMGGVPDTKIYAHILTRIYLYLGARVLIISIVRDIIYIYVYII